MTLLEQWFGPRKPRNHYNEVELAIYKNAYQYDQLHGTMVVNHKHLKMEKAIVPFVFPGLSAPPALTPATLTDLFSAFRSQGFIPLQLNSYWGVQAVSTEHPTSKPLEEPVQPARVQVDEVPASLDGHIPPEDVKQIPLPKPAAGVMDPENRVPSWAGLDVKVPKTMDRWGDPTGSKKYIRSLSTGEMIEIPDDAELVTDLEANKLADQPKTVDLTGMTAEQVQQVVEAFKKPELDLTGEQVQRVLDATKDLSPEGKEKFIAQTTPADSLQLFDEVRKELPIWMAREIDSNPQFTDVVEEFLIRVQLRIDSLLREGVHSPEEIKAESVKYLESMLSARHKVLKMSAIDYFNDYVKDKQIDVAVFTTKGSYKMLETQLARTILDPDLNKMTDDVRAQMNAIIDLELNRRRQDPPTDDSLITGGH